MSVSSNQLTTLIEAQKQKPIPRLRTPFFTMREIENQLAQILSRHFSGLKFYDPAIALKLRSYLNTFFSREIDIRERSILINLNTLMPIALSLQKFLHRIANNNGERIKNVADFNVIKSELNSHIQAREINAAWLTSFYFRTAAVLSQPSFDEKDIFAHVADKSSLSKLYDYNDEDHRLDFVGHFLAIYDIDKADQQKSSLSIEFDYNFFKKLQDKLEKMVIQPLYYPIAGQGKFGLSFLISTYLNNEFLLGLPLKNNRAHGVDMSPLSFMVHDVFHANIDTRYEGLKSYVVEKINAFNFAKGDVNKFPDDFLRYAVNKQEDLMQVLKNLYRKFLTELYPRYGKRELDKTIAGFFIMLHEFPKFKAKTYKSHDLEEIIHQLVDDAIEELYEDSHWESSYDLFKTSPFDGNILLSETELQEVLGKIKGTFAQAMHYDSIHTIHIQNSHIKVAVSPRFVDVTFSMKNGTEHSLSFATLYHKWQNIDDMIYLLKFVGIEIVKPELNLDNLEGSRLIVQQVLSEVQNEMKKLMLHFKERAIFYANRPDQEGLSLRTNYYNFHSKKERQFDVILNELAQVPCQKMLARAATVGPSKTPITIIKRVDPAKPLITQFVSLRNSKASSSSSNSPVIQNNWKDEAESSSSAVRSMPRYV